MSASTQPSGGGSSHKAVNVEPVGTAVEGKAGFVKPRLRRHGPDRIAGHIRSVDCKHLHAAPERNGKGSKQVPLVHAAAHLPDVPPGIGHSSGIKVGGVEFQLWVHSQQGRTHGPGPATEIDHNTGRNAAGQNVAGRNAAGQNVAGRGKQFQSRLDEQLGPPTGHKDTLPYFDPLTEEFGPAQDIFKRNACAAPLHPAGQFRGAGTFGHQERGLLLSENTAGSPQGGDNSSKSQGSGR